VARSEFAALTVAAVDRLCADAVAITFRVPPALADRYAFRPGQSLTVRRMADGHDERRSYSICSPLGAPLRIGVREIPSGTFSRWLAREVRPGDQLDVSPPSGTFTPELDAAADHVLIAAGSGITPLLSIASSVLQRPRSRVTLIYGNRRSDSVMFADEVADLKDAHHTRMQLAHVLSREPQEVALFTGRLDAPKLRGLLPALCVPEAVDHWWLCGPYGMVVDATDVLREFAVPNGRVHRELFYVEDTPPPPVRHDELPVEGSAVTVVLDGRSTTITVPRDTTILDGAARARPDLPFACKGGVCGTCRARVVSGEVAMRRNFALEEAELDAGFVLTCQSRPVSEAATVDYDA
jgi:ring-1,2-phenylacetyl-CoA epoxidase subunit PaaE